MADGQVVFDIRGDSSKLDDDLKKAEETITKGAGSIMAAIGAAAAAAGAAAIKVTDDLDKSVNQVTASLGLTKEAANEYRESIKQIYSDNYGESFEDIANSIGLIKQQMTDLSDGELVKVTESAYLLADVYEIDVTESIRGANAMVKQFGISAEEAYNLIAQGAEKGLNQNGDLADQLSEYATYYAQLGFSAEDALNMMSTAAENGVFQIDYLNDAVKEFGIRAIDGSKTTAEGFEAIGLNASELGKTFAAGGQDAADAFQLVVEKLGAMDDEIAQDAAGVALFGTKWEDLGKDAILALAETNDAIDSTRDKLSEMEGVKYESLSDQIAAIKRNIELLLEPLGQELIPVIKETIEELMPVVEKLIPDLANVAKAIITFVAKDVIPCLINVIKFIAEHKEGILILIGALAALKAAFAITTVIQNFSSMMKTATAVQTALNAAMAANPIGIVVAALALLTAGLIAFTAEATKANEETQRACRETDDYIDKCEKLNDTIKSNAEARADNVAEIESEASANEMLTDKLFKLTEQENKSAGDKAEILALVEQLNTAIPELGLNYDEETGKLSKQKNEIYELIEANKRLYLVKAQEENLSTIAKEISDAEIRLKGLAEEKEKLKQIYDENHIFNEEGYLAMTQENINNSNAALESIEAIEAEETLLVKTLESANIEWESTVDYIRENSAAVEEDNEKLKDRELTVKTLNTTSTAYIEKLKETQEVTNNLVDSVDDLADAFKEQSEQGSLSVDTMLDLIDKGYASILMIDDETNAVKLNAKAYEELQRAKIKAQKAEVQRQIIEVTSEYQTKAARLAMEGKADESYKMAMSSSAATQELRAQMVALDKLEEAIPSITAGTYTGAGIRKPTSTTKENPTKTTASGTSSSSSATKTGNVVNITSYIPTVWDDAATANAKLAMGLGASIVGNSVTGKLISGNLSAGTSAAAATTAAAQTKAVNTEATLNDVVSAVKTLGKEIKTKKVSLEVIMKARNLTIGKVAVEDINEITKAQGYSPLEG